jgi:hypothetical protein
MEITASAPVIRTASAMVSGRCEGWAPQTPDSYTTSMPGATVRRASSAARVGSPIPANTVRRAASSREATTESSSDAMAVMARSFRCPHAAVPPEALTAAARS